MKKTQKHVIVIKKIEDKLGEKTEVLAVSKKDALDYIDLIKDEEVTITIFDDEEKIVFSKVKSKNPKYHFDFNEHEHHYNHNNHGHQHHHHHEDEDDDDSYA
jgi:hypothetical protein